MTGGKTRQAGYAKMTCRALFQVALQIFEMVEAVKDPAHLGQHITRFTGGGKRAAFSLEQFKTNRV